MEELSLRTLCLILSELYKDLAEEVKCEEFCFCSVELQKLFKEIELISKIHNEKMENFFKKAHEKSRA